jgi:chemotaxis protein CheX
MVELIDQFIIEVTHGVFNTMLNQKVVPLPTGEGHGMPMVMEVPGVNGSVGFGGKMAGTLFFSVPETVAHRMATILIGGLCEVGPHELCDVVGEVTNMLAGGCKSRLCDAGYPVFMTIPNIIRGKSLRLSGRGVSFMVRRRFHAAGLDGDVDVLVMGKVD